MAVMTEKLIIFPVIIMFVENNPVELFHVVRGLYHIALSANQEEHTEVHFDITSRLKCMDAVLFNMSRATLPIIIFFSFGLYDGILVKDQFKIHTY